MRIANRERYNELYFTDEARAEAAALRSAGHCYSAPGDVVQGRATDRPGVIAAPLPVPAVYTLSHTHARAHEHTHVFIYVHVCRCDCWTAACPRYIYILTHTHVCIYVHICRCDCGTASCPRKVSPYRPVARAVLKCNKDDNGISSQTCVFVLYILNILALTFRRSVLKCNRDDTGISLQTSSV